MPGAQWKWELDSVAALINQSNVTPSHVAREPNDKDRDVCFPNNYQHIDETQRSGNFRIAFTLSLKTSFFFSLSLSSHRAYLLIIFSFLLNFYSGEIAVSSLLVLAAYLTRQLYLSAIIPLSHFNGSICFISVFLISWICSSKKKKKIAAVPAISASACNTRRKH